MEPRPQHNGDWVITPREDLCLDFANTLYWRGTPTPTERLQAWSDVLDWYEAAKLLPAGQVTQVRRWFRDHDREASGAFRDAIALRESLYAIFSATAAQKKPRDADLATLNRALAESPPRRALRGNQPGYGWAVTAGDAVPATLLAPILWSASDLLVGARLARVRRCANDACLWLFLDDSKSGNRRWCSMSGCGNRAKAHRHYVRHKDD